METEGLASDRHGLLTEGPRENPLGGRLHPPVLCGPQSGRRQENSIPEGQGYRSEGKYDCDPKDRFQQVVQKLQATEIFAKDLVELYLKDQYRRNLRFDTISNSLSAITSFLKLVAHSGKARLADIGRDDLAAYVEQEQDRGLKATTVKNRLDTLKAFLRHLIERGDVGAEVLSKRMTIKTPQCLPRAMETEDEKKFLSVIDNTRNRAMILLLLRTGMRIGELLNTQVRDIDLAALRIDIWEASKNRVGRVVYFTEDARAALLEWLGERDPGKDYVFYAPNRQTLTYAGARAMFCNYLAKAGLSHKGYTLHCLRHTNASALLNAGMPLECLKELLGHTSVEVTRRYARLTNKTREKEYFKAMARIEKGETDGYYRLDLELQEILEKEKLLSSHGEKLHEQS